MVFSSMELIFRFLPVFFLIYYIVPNRLRNGVLLLGSLVFYTIGEPYYVLLLIISVLMNYLLARKIATLPTHPKFRKAWFVTAVLFNTGSLAVCKYTDFLFDNLNELFSLIPNMEFQLPLSHIVMPIGVSFYTFQAISYVADVYLGKQKPEKNIGKVAIYLMMFPRVVQGPIVRYKEVEQNLTHRTIDRKLVEKGFSLFITGLVSKVLLADPIGTLFTDVRTTGFESISTPMAWLGAIAFSLQLYFDFAGYSLMAVGLGEMLGFCLPFNFDHPYTAKSVSEFWRRWHITLGRWFKDYIYIPLGGNRKGMFRTIRNLLVVWLLTGLWHGAGWNFVLWGLFTFFFICIEKLCCRKILDRWRVIPHLYMMLYIPVSWILFAVTDLSELAIYMKKMFFIHDPLVYVNVQDILMAWKDYGLLIIIALFACTTIPAKLYQRYRDKIWLKLILFLLFWICIYRIAGSAGNPFLYLRF